MSEHMSASRAWLARPCPTCGVGPQRACRDDDGYLGNPHEARLAQPKATS